MSDVPVAAFWAVAIYGCLLGSTVGAILAGIAAAVAILIRPNLVHLAVLMSLWLIVRDLKQRRRGSALLNLIAFAIPVGIAGLAIGYLNRELYGEATTSGYGPLGYIYSQYRAPTNVVRYSYWLIQSNTPIAFAGLLALFVPLSLGAFGRLKIPGRGLLTTICAGAIGTYLVYIIFDAWWYLRFLLPAWPAIFVSTAWLLSWPSGRSYGRAALVLLFGVGVYGLWFAQHRAGVFSFGEDDRRYATVGHLVRDATPPNSIIFSMQHSGSVRYYSGRMSLRYDFLNQRWLDRAVDWLNREGMHPYFLLDEWEVKEFERRFEAVNALAHLHVARVWEYRGAPRVFLYDPLQPERTGEKSVIFYTSEQRLPSCPVPEPPPHFVVR